MQANDSNNNSFDDKFFDQAWENMQETLDREMPEKKKKRRFIFWYYLMAGSFIGFLLWFGVSNNQQSEIKQPLVEKVDAIENLELASAISKTESDKKTETGIIDLKESDEKYKVVKNKISSVQSNEIKFSSTSKSISQNKTTKEPQSENIISDEIEIVSNNAFTKKENISTLASINPVLENNFQRPELIIEENKLSKGISNLCPPKRKIEYGAFVGTAIDFSIPEKLGLTSGLTVHFPLGKKWGIRTGIGYSLLKKNVTLEDTESFEVTPDAHLLNSGNGGFDPSLNSPVFSLENYQITFTTFQKLAKIHYLDIPLLATFQLGRKWEIQSGANFSKAFYGKLELNPDEDFALVDNDPDFDLSAEQVNRTELSKSVWKKDYVSGVLGVSWKPNKRLNLNLQYQQRFSDIAEVITNKSGERFNDLNTSSGAEMFASPKDFYRSLRFTLGYRF